MADVLTEPGLEVDDFPAFFKAVYGVPPFPWQTRLLEQVATTGVWPEVLDLPTGTGKTAAIDVAVFHLALEVGREARRAPLRIVYVVDRRTIVDQAFERARRLSRAIAEATDAAPGILARVRARLARVGEASLPPLTTALLRGAIARSDQWAKSPSQPLIAVSTVDQVGSRLLFRGYGVSDTMKSIHAGLLGNDALYLLDEVHLSTPFRETLEAIATRYRGWAESPVAAPLRVVEMSATPHGADRHTFRLAADDESHPVLARRLDARKPVTHLEEVKGAGFIPACETAVTTYLDEAAGAANGLPGLTVGVVVNRVASARDLQARLAKKLTGRAEVKLITGRMRPLEREGLERELVPRIATGRDRARAERPLVVVATQCIEAGADFDFDVLVTECASLDALRQRFGRLDRVGEYGRAKATILARADALKDDPVYGEAYRKTWEWLKAQDGVDFGLRRLQVPAPEVLVGLSAPIVHAPVLLPAHLDAWVQTAPIPTPDPDIALWLHGPSRGAADVQVVWRADLDARDLEAVRTSADDAEASRERALAAVEAVAPSSAEAMAVPIDAVRRWLAGREEATLADVEGAIEREEDGREPRVRDERWAVSWRGDDSEVIGPERIKPGATIVVPATYGGIAEGTWAPSSSAPVVDLGDQAATRQRGKAVVRLHPAVIGGDAMAWPKAKAGEPAEDERDARQEAVERMKELLELPLDPDRLDALRRLVVEADTRRGVEIDRVAGRDGEWLVVIGRRKVLVDDASGDGVTTEDDRASFTGVEVLLESHMTGVGAMARKSAEEVGAGLAIASDVELAGRWHDAGKADVRFQRLLHGGSEFRALAAPAPIAKSSVPMVTREARERARLKSGYPRGQRHELASLALIEDVAALRAAARDWELVQHLVASHHGHCRPLAPWVEDRDAGEIRYRRDGIEVAATGAHELARLDSGVGERFWGLVRRYGWWGLAWLEAMLRLADHRQSEREQAAPAKREGGA